MKIIIADTAPATRQPVKVTLPNGEAFTKGRRIQDVNLDTAGYTHVLDDKGNIYLITKGFHSHKRQERYSPDFTIRVNKIKPDGSQQQTETILRSTNGPLYAAERAKATAPKLPRGPHEMTKAEYVKKTEGTALSETRLSDPLITKAQAEDFHSFFVERALAEGKSIPADVLKDYPGLKPARPA